MPASNTPINIIHADHALDVDHLHIVETVVRKAEGFFIEVIELPESCASLQCALYGPSVGDEPVAEVDVEYVHRAERVGPSRLVNRPTRPCRRMVVIGVGGEHPSVYTAYGTQADSASPREWWDPTMTPAEAIVAAKYWNEHALARPQEEAS